MLFLILLLLGMSAVGNAYAQVNRSAAGKPIFNEICSACHGADGRGGERAPDIATRTQVVDLTDSDLTGIVVRGVPGTGMPPFGYIGDEKIGDIVAYLRTLQGRGQIVKVAGDPHKGEYLFFGSAGCATCHMMHGRGGVIGEDLSQYAIGRSLDSVRQAIVDPSTIPGHTGDAVTLVTRSGQHWTGVVRAESNFTVVLQTEDGVFHAVSKQNLLQELKSGHVLMPANYGTMLNSGELEDLISFLYAQQLPPQPTKMKVNK